MIWMNLAVTFSLIWIMTLPRVLAGVTLLEMARLATILTFNLIVVVMQLSEVHP